MHSMNYRPTDNQEYGKANGVAAKLGCGIATARKIGKEADAEVKYGKTIFYNLPKIYAYMESLKG